MSQPNASLFSAIFAALIMLLMLASCGDSDVKLPHVFSGNEVPSNVMAEPRLVPVPPPDLNAAYPRLGDVPPLPKDFTPPPLIAATKREMEYDRDTAKIRQQQYEAAPPVLPSNAVQ
jgi:hypothetical protein